MQLTLMDLSRELIQRKQEEQLQEINYRAPPPSGQPVVLKIRYIDTIIGRQQNKLNANSML